MKKNIILTIEVLFIFLVTFFITQKCFMIAYIPSESMEDTLQVHDFVLSNRLAYQFQSPERGDIIVFPAPFDNEKYIKRIVGMPGETVSFKDGFVYINGVKLEENYVKEKWDTEDVEDIQFSVPENSYFVMGDNRNFSYDARYWWQEALEEGIAESLEESMEYSFVKRENIIAKGWIKIFKGFKIY